MVMNELKRMVERGEITLRSAAFKLYRMGRVDYLPTDRQVLKVLHILF